MIKSRVIISICFITAILSYILGEGGTGLAFLLFTFILPITCFVVSRISGKNFKILIKIDEKKEDDNRYVINFFQKNISVIPVFSWSMDFTVHNITTGDSVHEIIRHKQQYELVSEHCGCVEVKAKKIKIYDFFGIFSRAEELKIHKFFYIPPKIMTFDIDIDELDSFDLDSYEFSSIQKGDDPSEVFDLREHMPGDKMKSVHWKLSSKLDDLIIKEHSFPVDNRTVLILNNLMSKPDELTSDDRDELITLFVSTSASLSEKGVKHWMGWYDYSHENFVMENIEDINDLWKAVPLIMKAGYGVDHIAVPYHYVERIEDYHFSNYIYVTNGDIRDIERLEELGEVKIFTPTKFK